MFKQRNSQNPSPPGRLAPKGQDVEKDQDVRGSGAARLPSISLPKGGGAIRGIGEKFAANPVTGTGAMTVPIATSPSRSGFGPELMLSYDSGTGNGPFGFGWNLSLPSIIRKTDKGLPQYWDAEESDVFILSGAEDMVPVLMPDSSRFEDSVTVEGYTIHRYRPRIEGLFARIERWTEQATGETHWRSTTPENITTIYGRTSESRIADPANPLHVFTWLICESYDDKGNAVVYEYAAENDENVHRQQVNERNRERSANRYLKRIQYGNRLSHLTEPDLTLAEWLFEVIFDYDENYVETVAPDSELTDTEQHRLVMVAASPGGLRAVRPDPFSIHRAGFEVRTYRRCRRVLMFHNFDELGDEPSLVASTEFDYADLNYSQPATIEDELAHQGSTRFASFIRAVTQSGFIRDDTQAAVERSGVNYFTYFKQSLPPLEFEYSKAAIQDDIRELDAGSLENLPIGLDDATYLWVDLDGEGVTGILTEQANAWFYKPNLGEGKFGLLKVVAPKPSFANLNGGRQQLLDLAGDGQLELVDFARPTPGFYERTGDEDWEPFRAFAHLPNIGWDDPNLRFVDLNGDGHADVLLTENEVLTWYSSRGEEGFDAARQVRKPFDEELGPRLVLADGTQSIYLADMCGDGLTDLVRIRNGEVCYWPNLGYGRFGLRVVLDNSPWFDHPDQFNQQRVRLADIDGSGTIDIIYLGRDGVCLYFNQSGNRLSEPRLLKGFPQVDNLSAVMTADLLGNGTACLVWSSPLPGNARRPLRYIDLMGGQKPHLLIKSVNNLGAETHINYVASTKFYLADKLAGKPWITKVPFPVHVVERVETRDHISRNRFVARYAYHHGYFDGNEREFRGFGLVEQWDTEAFEDYVSGVTQFEGGQELGQEFYQPPVLTRTWFHTGAYFDGHRILHELRDEYYQQEQYLPEAVLPANLDAEEFREGVRALKGSPLRIEVYSFDGTTQEEQHPFIVVENNYEIQLIQHRGEARHAVLMSLGRESVTLYHERNPSDPRITHSFSLEYDLYGNVLKSASVVYGRQMTDTTLPTEVREDQQRMYVAYTENDYTTDIASMNPTAAYRLRVPYESRSYEITGISTTFDLFIFDEIKSQIAGADTIAYEIIADGVTPQKRLLSQGRILFLDNNLNPLPLGQRDTLGLSSQSFQLALTPEVVATHYAGQVSDADLTAAGYVHFAGDANWWIPSGTAIYPANPQQHFYIPIGTTDPLGVETIATFDKYDLLTERVRIQQATWSEVTAINDYRVLGPVMMTDPNKNRSAVQIDALGQVVKSAVMGKEVSGDGDTLDDPTMRMEYELFNWMEHGKPNFVHTFAREQHGASNPRWMESYVYSNGGGGVAMVKAQAHPGLALQVDEEGKVTEAYADPRWVGNGRTVLNNKGKPVKQYEPYFSITHEYEDEQTLREIGVTPLLYYDAMGRNIRTLSPNGTLSRVEFNPWMQKIFDGNDTVTESQWYAERGSPNPAEEAEPLNDPERRAAWLAAKHTGTPGVFHLDSLGRPVYGVSDYGGGLTATARTESDLTGRFFKVFDQLQREVSNGFNGMTGIPIWSESAEKGRRWLLPNVLGAVVKTWDEHGREVRVEYDNLHRPLSTFVQELGQSEILFNYLLYGDRHPDAENLNLLGVPHLIFDQSGLVRVPELDFKGNPKSAERILTQDYENYIDWTVVAGQPDYDAVQTAANALLETGEVFTASSVYDALNRPTRVTLPDATIIVPTYNEAGFLATLQAQIRGQGVFIEFLKEQDYDAKGQRQFAHYGNDLYTRYFYDAKTFRLAQLLTYPSGTDPETNGLQNLRYTYDPVGNLTQVSDDAQQTYYFNNAVVKPESLYEYDALYQLVRATGREHAGGTNDAIRDHGDLLAHPQLPHPNNLHAVRTYTEDYEYDLLGNLQTLRHRFRNQAGVGVGWTRHYQYAYEDDATNRTNRLSATSETGDPNAGPYSATYDYDVYGNMIHMPHLTALDWNFMDQLRQVDLGGGGTAHYVYNASGTRIRKVINRLGTTQLEWIYLGPVMIFRRRRRDTGVLELERWTVHLSDNAGPFAQVDTKTTDVINSDPDNPLNVPLIRYQYSNHLGSAAIETNDTGNVISYEEYHPYGTSAYRSAKPGFDLSLKRFRFSGKERDDETGLYYFGARYYAAWLGRWTSSDPAGFVDGANLFKYCGNNPVSLKDRNGLQTEPITDTLRYSTQQSSNTANDKMTVESFRAIFPNLDPRINSANANIHYDAPLIKTNSEFNTYSKAPGGTWILEASFSGMTTEGTAPSQTSPQTPAESPPVKTEGVTNPNLALPVREGVVSLNQPKLEGDVLKGPLNLWSGDEAKAANAKGYTLGKTDIQKDIEKAVEAAKSERGGRNLDWPTEERPIWAEGSKRLAQEATLGQRGVQSHGLETHPNPSKTIQMETEIPTVRRWGGGMAALGGLSGFATIYAASQIKDPVVKATGYAAGIAEVSGAAAYATGSWVVGSSSISAPLMSVGRLVGGIAGGVGMAVISGYMAVEEYQSGDYVAAAFDAGAAIGGVAIIAGTILVGAAAAPFLLIGGAVLGALALGFHLARWMNSYLAPTSESSGFLRYHH